MELDEKKTPHQEVTPNIRIIQEELKQQFGIDHFGEQKIKFFSKRNNFLLGENISKIVVNDHGCYLEVEKTNLNRKHMLEGPLSKQKYFYCDKSRDGVKVYRQNKSVSDKPNPPPGVFSCNFNREKGYADYIPGKCYVPINSIKASLSIRSQKFEHQAY